MQMTRPPNQPLRQEVADWALPQGGKKLLLASGVALPSARTADPFLSPLLFLPFLLLLLLFLSDVFRRREERMKPLNQ